jgi:sulfite exporter TauE/SafE
MLAGVLLMVQGLAASGALPWRAWTGTAGGCLGPSLFAVLLHAPRFSRVFLAGVINGILPCGLVYAYLALAAGSGAMWTGGLTMFLFGLGTMPLMVLVGSSGHLLGMTSRRRLWRLAAWCVVLTGVISLLRGVGFVDHVPFSGPSDCALCP